jgi:hypothetical protein
MMETKNGIRNVSNVNSMSNAVGTLQKWSLSPFSILLGFPHLPAIPPYAQDCEGCKERDLRGGRKTEETWKWEYSSVFL